MKKIWLLLILLLTAVSCSTEPTSATPAKNNVLTEKRAKNGSNAKASAAKSIFQIRQTTGDNSFIVSLTGDEFIQDEAIFVDPNMRVGGLPEGSTVSVVAVAPTQLVLQVTNNNLSLVGQYNGEITFSEAVFKESLEPVTAQVKLLYGTFDKQYLFETIAGFATVPRLDGLPLSATIQLTSAPTEGLLTDGELVMRQGDTIPIEVLNSGTLFYKSFLDYEWYGTNKVDSIVFELVETNETLLVQYAIENPTGADLPASPNAWFDASSRNSLMVEYGVFAEADAPLTIWRDHSQNNIPAFVPSDRPRPLYRRAPFLEGYDKPAVAFVDTGNRFERKLGIIRQDDFSAYSYAGAFQLSNPNAAHALHSAVTANSGRGGLFFSDGLVASRTFNTQDASIKGETALANEWVVASNSNSFDAAVAHKLFLNGRLEATSTLYPDITDFSMLTLGDAQTSVEQSFLGNMGEVLFFDKHLSDYELMKVDEYLTLRWGNGRLNDARNSPERVAINATFLTGRHFIYDSPFDDTILGSQQNDMLYIHDGDDFVAGNYGADRFIFLGDGHKTISDFDAETDTLDFSQLIEFRPAANMNNYFQADEMEGQVTIKVDPEGQAKFSSASLQITLIGATQFDSAILFP